MRFKTLLQDRSSLSKPINIALAELLGKSFSKISIAGGEALLCPYIVEIFGLLKINGATTSLVTNGARLIDEPELLDKLAPVVDWIGISIDSFDPVTQKALGRAKGGRAYSPEQYAHLAARIKQYGIRLKVNSVVTTLNADEYMAPWITKMEPERWKVFQVLPIEDQNNGAVNDLLISEKVFGKFTARHRKELGSLVVAESNEAMKGTYAMIDPAGRFFDNVTGRLHYSRPIQDVGLPAAWEDVKFDMQRFRSRGGEYNW